MNAFPMVNQSASVILTTVGHAKKLKIPEEKWVYPMGGAHFTDVKNVTYFFIYLFNLFNFILLIYYL